MLGRLAVALVFGAALCGCSTPSGSRWAEREYPNFRFRLADYPQLRDARWVKAPVRGEAGWEGVARVEGVGELRISQTTSSPFPPRLRGVRSPDEWAGDVQIPAALVGAYSETSPESLAEGDRPQWLIFSRGCEWITLEQQGMAFDTLGLARLIDQRILESE